MKAGPSIRLEAASLAKYKAAGAIQRIRVAEEWEAVDSEWRAKGEVRFFYDCAIQLTTDGGKAAEDVKSGEIGVKLLFASGGRKPLDPSRRPFRKNDPPLPPITVVGSSMFYFEVGAEKEQIVGVEVELRGAKANLAAAALDEKRP